MLRLIVAFHEDDNSGCVAELDCYHLQHVRHKPPFFNHPWIETRSGRESKIGTELDCLRCDQFEWPEGLTSYRKTPVFTETSIPKGLLKDHSIKVGTWGLLKVLDGEITFQAASMGIQKKLVPGSEQIIVPSLLHHITPGEDAACQIEFYRRQKSGSGSY